MEKCKFCGAELEEGVTLCSACGKENLESTEQTVSTEEVTEAVEETPAAEEVSVEEATEIKSGVQATPGKIALAAAAIVVLLAALIGLILMGMEGSKKEEPSAQETAAVTVPAETTEATIPQDGNPEDVSCKGSYTVTDEELMAQKDVVVAAAGDKELTNGMLQMYYWDYFMSNYYTFAAYYGLDPARPLDTQLIPGEAPMTWQQFFLQYALLNWQQYQTMSQAAQEAGLSLSQEELDFLDGMEAGLTENAAANNMTLDEMLKASLGASADLESYTAYREDILWADMYYRHISETMVPTEADLEAYFTANEEAMAQSGITKDSKLVDVRHILLMPQGGTAGENGVTTYTEEEWAACEKEAQAVLDSWLAGEKTEESFAALANEKSVDGGSNQNGGLYQDVYVGQMVQAFNDWCFDESRQYGDYGLVKTEYGYHIMFFVESRLQWKQSAEAGWVQENTVAKLTALMEASPLEVQYEKIVLGTIQMG